MARRKENESALGGKEEKNAEVRARLRVARVRGRESVEEKTRERESIDPTLQERQPLAGLTSLPLRSTRRLLCAAYQFA